MQIGIDLRFLNTDGYSVFIEDLIQNILNKDHKNTYILYVWNKKNLKNININFEHVILEELWIKNNSLQEQYYFYKILKRAKHDLVLFFNHYKPILYKDTYYTFISSLKDLYYDNFKSTLQKNWHNFLFEKNIHFSEKLICFDENTKQELIERCNIKENLIYTLHGFFPNTNSIASEDIIDIDMGSKYQLSEKYLIYPGDDGIEKNLDKLLEVFFEIRKENNVQLVLLGNTIAKNIALRDYILHEGEQENIKFLWELWEAEKYLIYKQSSGVIFPSLYSPFPFELWDAIKYNTPIIASQLKSIVSIFWKNISYFSPISKSSIKNNINTFLNKKTHKIDYKEIKETYTQEASSQSLLSIIQ